MRVPFIDLHRLQQRVRHAAHQDFGAILERCEFVGGPTVERLEARLCEELGVPHVIACASGTSALTIALHALDLPRGSKVALPDVTFWATYEAIAVLGHTPVLLDIDPDDLQLSFDALVRAHERERLAAVVLPHLFGWASARLSDIRAFCARESIPLVEDGAQCFGVERGGAPVLAGARLATLSFYPAKVVGGAMDGGAIVAQSREDADLVRMLCNHGRRAHYAYDRVGFCSRMGGLQASYLLRVLDELPWILATRRAALAQYQRFAETSGVRFFGPPGGQTGNGYLAVFAGRSGESLARGLHGLGIGTARTYPEPLHLQRPTDDAIRFGDLAASTAFCEQVVNLPLFAGITADEVSVACEALAEVLAR